MHASSTVTVLLVEDDEVDAEAVQRAFRAERLLNPIVRAVDGLEALAILRGQAGRARLPRPCVILLDLSLPRMSGHEFLKRLRADPELTDHVVFVLTSSRAQSDVLDTYAQHVAGYIVKADAGVDFVRLLKMLGGYWRVVELPGERP